MCVRKQDGHKSPMHIVATLLCLIIGTSAELLPSEPQPDLPAAFTATLDAIAQDCSPSGEHKGDCSPRDCSLEDCSVPRNFNASWPGYRRELQVNLDPIGTNGCIFIDNLPTPCVCSATNGGQRMEIECSVQVSSWFTVRARLDIEPCADEPHIEFFFRCPVASLWIPVKRVEYGYTVWAIPVLPGTLSVHVPMVGSAGVFLGVTLGGRPSFTTISFTFDICGSVRIPFYGEVEICGGDLGIPGMPYTFWESKRGVNFGSVCYSPPPPPQSLSATASPPPPTSNTLWTIISGSEYCQIYQDNCVTDGYGLRYGANEACIIKANVQLSVTAAYFDTEEGYDILSIGATSFSGTTGPSTVPMKANWNIFWSSDSSVQKGGFTICATACSDCLALDGVCYRYTCGNMCQGTTCKPPPAPPVSPPASPSVPVALGCTCATSCVGSPTWSGDGYCDDGGSGSEYTGCQFGTDCEDCGTRCEDAPPNAPPIAPSCSCSDECIGAPAFASDGYCDDGGQGSQYNGCQIGSDCGDCGVRCDLTLAIQPPSSPPLVSSLTATASATPTTEPPCPPLSSLPLALKSPTPPPVIPNPNPDPDADPDADLGPNPDLGPDLDPKYPDPDPNPNPPSPAPSKFTVLLSAAGSIADYGDASYQRLQRRFASVAGVKASAVTITIVAASVIITADIIVPANTASRVRNALSSSFTSADAASTLLGIAVVSTPSISQTHQSQISNANTSSSSSGSSIGLILGVVGGVIAGIVIGVVAGLVMKKNKAVNTKVGVVG